ncbi:hypothetical protein GCM10022408_34110 [Hymenobacter fastidiosus]|uniref:Integrase n=1 Tax=Hymenobacter fastidiosus TaxID=486264 RepID=A0ABP7SWQ9_9BACT
MNKRTPTAVAVTGPVYQVELARTSAKVAGFLEAGLKGAANTTRGYTSDVKSYLYFCTLRGLTPLPAD